MAWRTSPPELVDLFERAVPQGRGIERRKMFGYPRTLAAWLAAALRYVRSLPPKQPKTARRDNTLKKKRSSR